MVSVEVFGAAADFAGLANQLAGEEGASHSNMGLPLLRVGELPAGLSGEELAPLHS